MLNSLRRIFAISQKEWIQIRRDARSLILSFLSPALLILLFGYALTLDVKHVKFIYMDQDNSSLSRQFMEKFSHTEYLNVLGNVSSYEEIDNRIDRGQTSLALIIPSDFESSLKTNKTVDVQLLVDGSDSMTSTVAFSYITAIVEEFNMNLQKEHLARIGIQSFNVPLEARTRIWYNPELLSKNFIIPGLVILILAIISALITSLTMSREWERGTMETLLTTPVAAQELLIGKIIPYLLIGAIDVVFTLLLGRIIFAVPIHGHFSELLLASMLFLTGTSGLGILLSAATRMQVLSIQTAILATYLPSLILSGFIFPVENMPKLIQGITYLVPAKYMMTIIKGIALKGIGLSLLYTQILFLAIFATVILILAYKKILTRLPEA